LEAAFTLVTSQPKIGMPAPEPTKKMFVVFISGARTTIRTTVTPMI
jgi:hypothetical protein